MRDRSTLGAAGLVVAALALASLAAQPRSPAAPSASAASASRPSRVATAASVPARPTQDDAPGATALARAEHVGVLRDGGRIDLNLATAGDLELLPGIGPTLARRIVEDRVRGGAYRSADDLVRVSGIGPGKLERIRALIRVDTHGGDVTAPVQRSNRNTPDSSAVK